VQAFFGVLHTCASKARSSPVRIVMLIIDVVIEIVLNRHLRTGEAVVPLYNLDVEHLCTSSKNTRTHRIKFFLLNVNLLTDAEEDLNLVI
jgi:hypothetical protein